jgi:hypothetical protein
MTRTNLRALLAALSIWGPIASAPARADSACMQDALRYCPTVPIGEGRVLTCLQTRWKDLASACQQEIQTIHNRARAINLACTNDVWQFCRGVAPGADRIRVCLSSRWDDLSSACRDTVTEVAEKAQNLSELCANDMERLCPGIKAGGGQIFLCLKAQKSKTSSQCQTALR